MMTAKETHAMELLVSYLFEAHEEEIRNGHCGDAEKPGFAPDVCSYCRAIEQAYTVRGMWDEWDQFCENVENGEAFR